MRRKRIKMNRPKGVMKVRSRRSAGGHGGYTGDPLGAAKPGGGRLSRPMSMRERKANSNRT